MKLKTSYSYLIQSHPHHEHTNIYHGSRNMGKPNMSDVD